MQSSNSGTLANTTHITQLRLLSFDAGGPRSLSQLGILEIFMHFIRENKYPNGTDRKMLPCEWFDLIAGSDTGGILGIMFAKLRMSVEEVSKVFQNICQMVYNTRLRREQRTQKLREIILDLLKSRDLPADLKLGNDDRQRDQVTRCFVVATRRFSLGNNVRLRTYRIRSEPSRDITVVDAVLATCATEPDFLPVWIDQAPSRQELSGGAMWAPNPASELEDEVKNLYPRQYAKKPLLFTLGTGLPGPFASRSSSENNERKLHRRIQSSGDFVERKNAHQLAARFRYFRFSVDQGLQESHDAEVNDPTWISTQTSTYLEGIETQERLQTCAKEICEAEHPVAIEQSSNQAPTNIPVESQYLKIICIIEIAMIIGIVFFCMLYPWTFLHCPTWPSSSYTSSLPEPINETLVMGQFPQLSRFHVPRGSFNWMEEQLINASRLERVTFVVYGMPGSGKTQTATYFIEKYRSHFSHVIWTDASSKKTFEQHLVSAIRTIPGYEEATLEAARHFLSSVVVAHNWLLILDNVDDPELHISNLLPRGKHGTVIITTRNRFRRVSASPSSAHMEVGPMNKEEAFQTLTMAANSTLPLSPAEEIHARELISELGHLALALVQAGSYCSARLSSPSRDGSSQPFGLYLSKLRLNSATLMNSTITPFVDERETPVYATFRLSYDVLSVPAQRLLHLLSFFERTSISLLVLHTAAHSHFLDAISYTDRDAKHENAVHQLRSFITRDGEWDEVTMDEILGDLERFSLVYRTGEVTFNNLRFHPLIHRWAGDILSPKEFSSYCDMAIYVLGSAAGHGNLTIQRLTLPHLTIMKDRNLLNGMEINMMAIGGLFRNYGHYAWAQEFVVNASRHMENSIVEDNAQLMDILLQLSNIRYLSGMEVEAAVLQERVLCWREKFLGIGHLDTTRAGEALVITYWKLERYEEAERLMLDVLLFAFKLAPPAADIQIFRPSCSNPTSTNRGHKTRVGIGLLSALQWCHKGCEIWKFAPAPIFTTLSFSLQMAIF